VLLEAQSRINAAISIELKRIDDFAGRGPMKTQQTRKRR
jgi:hypothetical protein